jgi:hypothetical protein
MPEMTQTQQWVELVIQALTPLGVFIGILISFRNGRNIEVVHKATNSLATRLADAKAQEGRALGNAEGLTQGLAQGRVIGHSEGLAAGRAEDKVK